MHLHWRSAGILACVLSVVVAVIRYELFDRSDPIHCNALLHRGSWLDPSLFQWQPHGCMLHNYTPKDGSACLASRDLVFIGDSVTRSLFFQFGRLLDPTLPGAPMGDNKKHQDYSLNTTSGTRLLFYWDPFLNGSHINNFFNPHSHETPQPALLVFGAGLWYLRYADRSGGLVAYESKIDFVLKSLHSDAADKIIILPVEEIVSSKLSHERASSMHSSDIDAMNSDLLHRINPPAGNFTKRPPVVPVSLPLVFNQMLDPPQTEDGLHFSDSIVRAQANILLNFRCNDYLPKSFPMDKTCCRNYPRPGIFQLLILAATILWGPYTVYASKRQWSFQGEQRTALIISLSIAFIYAADRSGLWLKEQKHYSPWVFAGLCLVSLAIGLYTVKRGDKDLGFLNREQTDEFKGWMQVVILIYHYLGASRIVGIYNPIRVLVAAYLFMTGYGHTSFYLLKADYGFSRVAQVLIRTNLFSLLLAYTMDTDYMFYYFAPLVSLWFCIIYTSMAIGSQYNDRTPFLVCKLLLSASLVACFMRQSWPLDTIFGALHRLFRVNWSAREWNFRVSLDLYIVYVGQFAALAATKIREYRLTEHAYWPMFSKVAIGVSAMILCWFFPWELHQGSKFIYNGWHPWVSWLPVLAFVVLRNASGTLRSASSRAFAFIGTCSLETFIIQYHFFLAADTKGVLVIIPGVGWRPVNFVLTWTGFLYISHLVAEAVTDITKRAAGATKTLPPPVTAPVESTKLLDKKRRARWKKEDHLVEDIVKSVLVVMKVKPTQSELHSDIIISREKEWMLTETRPEKESRQYKIVNQVLKK
ncbi:O-acetyltransferase [Mycena crocata]|nr:O-acetyltransferase [Mycena crocata]